VREEGEGVGAAWGLVRGWAGGGGYATLSCLLVETARRSGVIALRIGCSYQEEPKGLTQDRWSSLRLLSALVGSVLTISRSYARIRVWK